MFNHILQEYETKLKEFLINLQKSDVIEIMAELASYLTYQVLKYNLQSQVIEEQALETPKQCEVVVNEALCGEGFGLKKWFYWTPDHKL